MHYLQIYLKESWQEGGVRFWSLCRDQRLQDCIEKPESVISIIEKYLETDPGDSFTPDDFGLETCDHGVEYGEVGQDWLSHCEKCQADALFHEYVHQRLNFGSQPGWIHCQLVTFGVENEQAWQYITDTQEWMSRNISYR